MKNRKSFAQRLLDHKNLDMAKNNRDSSDKEYVMA